MAKFVPRLNGQLISLFSARFSPPSLALLPQDANVLVDRALARCADFVPPHGRIQGYYRLRPDVFKPRSERLRQLREEGRIPAEDSGAAETGVHGKVSAGRETDALEKTDVVGR